MELIVVGFQGRYRAAQVLTELRQRGMCLFDLDQAITISWEDRRNFIVQQSINLSREGGSSWAGLWGSFIKETMFQPFTEALSRAASKVANGSDKESMDGSASKLGRDWWVRDVGIPADFVRDVGALVQPGESAIIALAKDLEPSMTTSLLRDLGGSMVYTSLDNDQMEKVEAALAAGD